VFPSYPEEHSADVRHLVPIPTKSGIITPPTTVSSSPISAMVIFLEVLLGRNEPVHGPRSETD
jgi:hypothetical protein